MSQMCVCVVGVDARKIDKCFWKPITQVAEQAEMHIFYPPAFVETYMKSEKYDGYLIFDLADNAQYDNCEMIFSMRSPDLQSERIDAIVCIAEYIISLGYRFWLYIGESGASQEDELTHRNISIDQLRNELREYFTSIHGFPTAKLSITQAAFSC